MNKTATHWTAALVAAFCFLALGAWMDGPDDVQAAQAQSEFLNDAKAAAQQMSEQERIARRVCGSMHGEKAQILQLDTGEYVCRRKA